MSSYPYWVSLSNLGNVADGYSFTSNNVVLTFGETTSQSCTASLLNGTLPPGVSWSQQGFSIVLVGQVLVAATTNYEWTFRISNGTFSSDRTFKITVTKTTSSFSWETGNTQPLGYVYSADPFEFSLQAISDPVGSITYAITNLSSLTRGISIVANSGTVAVDIAWRPNTSYAVAKDYVYNQGQLYQCAITGVSGTSQGPLGTGVNIVDSSYEPWQANRFYPVNSVVVNDVGKIYVCVTPGTSAGTGGPTGTGANIVDNSVVWQFVTQAPTWNSVAPGTSLSLLLQASATVGTQTINRSFEILLLSRPYPPVWITLAGVLATPPLQINFAYQLDAFDPDGLALTWSSSNLPSWLNLSNVGLLWGRTPFVVNSTSYSFNIEISDGISTVSRNFAITVTENIQELSWITQENLGSLPDGTISNVAVIAQTTRQGALVTYGLHGGMIPPNLLIDSDTGAIQGFVEYHPQQKTYQFEVKATDGVDAVIRQFSLTVDSQNIGMFYTLSIPLLGPQRFDFVSQNNASIVDDQYLYLANDQGWGRTQYPTVTISSGIKRINAQSLREQIQNYLHNFRLAMLNYRVDKVADKDFSVVSLLVRDADSLRVWQPNTSYKTGQRVDNFEGFRYVAVLGGESGSTPPQGFAQNIQDGSVVWAFDSVPNPNVDRTYPLPWYAYHYYPANSTVVNEGLIFRSTNAGYSGGNMGPRTKQLAVTDNQVTWTYIGNTAYNDGNTYWPADIYNIRRTIESNVGWSTAWGTDASAVATVDTVSGAITAVSIVSQGTGYWSSPKVNAVGSGTSARFACKVGVVGATVVTSSGGFSVGEKLTVDLDHSSNLAVLEVVTINGAGQVVTLKVTNQGQFQHVPSQNYTIQSAARQVKVQFSAGVVSVSILSGGQGYTPGLTNINFAGEEYDPVTRQPLQNFELRLPLAYSQSQYDSVLSNHLSTTENPYAGQVIPVSLLQSTVEGIQWQGYTRFDLNLETFDSDSTRLVDFDPATETIEDSGLTYWDGRATTFDRNMISAWPDYSNTYFDDHRTIFDYYATLFDGRQPVYRSRWSATKFWYFGKPFDV